uniref:Uncharacterized protein n=1 Tax=Cacopsylla melanoneura TaxID=428564 RepID=A0A8D8VXW4_9HEMI
MQREEVKEGVMIMKSIKMSNQNVINQGNIVRKPSAQSLRKKVKNNKDQVKRGLHSVRRSTSDSSLRRKMNKYSYKNNNQVKKELNIVRKSPSDSSLKRKMKYFDLNQYKVQRGLNMVLVSPANDRKNYWDLTYADKEFYKILNVFNDSDTLDVMMSNMETYLAEDALLDTGNDNNETLKNDTTPDQ